MKKKLSIRQQLLQNKVKGFSLDAVIVAVAVLVVLVAVLTAALLSYIERSHTKDNISATAPSITIPTSDKTQKDILKENDHTQVVPGGMIEYAYDETAENQLVIVADTDFNAFQGVEVDGVAVDRVHYRVSRGSTVVTFTKDYSKTLAAGKHTITIIAQQEYAVAEVNVSVNEGGGSEGEVTYTELNNADLWEKGGFNSEKEYGAANLARTKGYLSADVALVYAQDDYVFMAAAYDSEDKFVGFWDGKALVSTSQKLYYLNPRGLAGYNIRLMFRRLDVSTLNVSESSHIHFLNAADAAAFAPQPTLTFIDDDGSLNALLNWESICDEVGIRITSSLITGEMGDNNDPNRIKVSWEDVVRLQTDKGFEFVSHTHNHINLLNSSDEECITQFALSIEALKEHGCEYRYLVYPYNAIDATKIPLVRQYFEAAVGLGGSGTNPGATNTLPAYNYWLRRYSINVAEETKTIVRDGETVAVRAFKDLATLKGHIDEAIVNNGWIIIMTHLRDHEEFYYDAEIRAMIIDLIKYAQSKGVAIKTFGEAYAQFKTIEDDGDRSVYAETHYVKDCNGVVHCRYKATAKS